MESASRPGAVRDLDLLRPADFRGQKLSCDFLDRDVFWDRCFPPQQRCRLCSGRTAPTASQIHPGSELRSPDGLQMEPQGCCMETGGKLQNFSTD